MSRLWNLFKPTPPAPLEERVVPSACAPVVDASAIDAIIAGMPLHSDAVEAIAAESAGPPPPLPEPPCELAGEFQGHVVPARQGTAHAIELHGQATSGDPEASTLTGTLLYDDPTQPETAPRATGYLQLARNGIRHRVRLESVEDRARASLMFPREFRATLDPEAPSPGDPGWSGTATLTLRTQNRRGKVPACQSFLLTVRPLSD